MKRTAVLEHYTQPNHVLDPDRLVGISDIRTIWNGNSTFADNLCEYSGRVCYQSTNKMGHSKNFLIKRLQEGHEDIIEHVYVCISFKDNRRTNPYFYYEFNRHCDIVVKHYGNFDETCYTIGANLRVWRDIFRQKLLHEAIPILKGIAPDLFYDYPGEPIKPDLEPYLFRGQARHILPRQLPFDGPRVTLLAFSQPFQSFRQSNATFLIEGISRACSHQFVRHRLASFSQASQRYIDLNKGEWQPVIPPAIKANPKTARTLQNAWNMLEGAYNELRSEGIRKEDARFLLPNAAETRFVVSMPMHAWSHFIWLRALDKAAQWEIRAVGRVILEMLYETAGRSSYMFNDERDELNLQIQSKSRKLRVDK